MTASRANATSTPPDDDALLESLAGLAHLAPGRATLTETLTRVAELAVLAVPGADGAGLTVLERERGDVLVATATFVTEVDEVQYGLGQGPCVSATKEGVWKRSDSLGADARWPQFGSLAAAMNVHSALSLPLITLEGVVGSMNIYAHARHAFSDRSVDLGRRFSVPAAIAVQNAAVLAQTQRLAAQLQTALSSRAVIDQAIGILMSRSAGNADEAFARLRTLGRSRHEKLNVVAQSVVDQAVARARSHSTR